MNFLANLIMQSEIKEPNPQLHIFFLKIALAIWDLSCFHTNCKNFCFNSMKNAISNLTGIVLNL